jgi:hypothetical protein
MKKRPDCFLLNLHGKRRPPPSCIVEELLSVDLGPGLSFLSSLGPSIDGVTVKNNYVEIRGKRSFETRHLVSFFLKEPSNEIRIDSKLVEGICWKRATYFCCRLNRPHSTFLVSLLRRTVPAKQREKKLRER